MSDSGILTVHLRDRIPEAQLRDELAKLFGVSSTELAPLENATTVTLVPYQYTLRVRGFQLTLEVYAGAAPNSGPKSDLVLAEHLAKRFAQDALISPPTGVEDVYQWLLVRPDGTTVMVSEIPPSDDDEDGIVIAEPHV